MLEFLMNPWPWYFSGPMIALVMFLLLWTGKTFGMSSNLRTLCAILGAGKRSSFFAFDWKAQRWNLVVAAGAILGGFLAANFLSNSTAVEISAATITQLNTLGIADAGQAYVPSALFDLNALSSGKALVLLSLGGFLWALVHAMLGCTSGHAISGLKVTFSIASLLLSLAFLLVALS